MAAAWFFSSMFMWKVSSWIFSAGLPTSLTILQRLVAGVDEIGLKPVERFEADLLAALLGVLRQRLLRFLTTVFHCFLYSGRGHGVGAARFRVNRADERGAVQHDHVVDEALEVSEADFLLARRAAQVAVRSHAGADRAADQPRLVELAFDAYRVDMRGVFDGQFDGFEAPSFDLLEQPRCFWW